MQYVVYMIISWVGFKYAQMLAREFKQVYLKLEKSNSII